MKFLFSRTSIWRLIFAVVIGQCLTGIHGNSLLEGKTANLHESQENEAGDLRPPTLDMLIHENDEELGDSNNLDEEIDFLSAYKRNPYAFGLGKRDMNEEGFEKRYLPTMMQLGKKEDPIYAFGLGKRNPYAFGLGKRNPYAFGLGKRDQYAFGLGKRNSYPLGLGKKRDPYAFGLGKRDPYSFGLGK